MKRSTIVMSLASLVTIVFLSACTTVSSRVLMPIVLDTLSVESSSNGIAIRPALVDSQDLADYQATLLPDAVVTGNPKSTIQRAVLADRQSLADYMATQPYVYVPVDTTRTNVDTSLIIDDRQDLADYHAILGSGNTGQ